MSDDMQRGGRPRRPETAWLGLVGSVWYIHWRAGGRDRRKSTGCRGREDAEAELARWTLARERPVKRPTDQVRVGQVLTAYLEWIASKPSAEQAAIEIEHHLAAAFGGLLVSELTIPAQEMFISERRAQGLAAGYIARILSTLRAACNRAYRTQMLSGAPPYVITVERPEPRARHLSAEEFGRLLAACEHEHLRRWLIVAINTGARPGAVLGLTWQQIDLAQRRIDFRLPTRQQTHKRRALVPITDALHTEMVAWAPPAMTGPVIEIDGRPIASIKKSFAAACRRAGLDDVTPNTLRHTAATWALAAGVAPWEVAGMLGHTSVRMVERTYGHHSPAYLQGVAAALSRGFSASLPQNGSNLARKVVGAAGIEPATPTMSTAPTHTHVVDFPQDRVTRSPKK